MIGLIKKMINSDHREPLNNLIYIQDLVTSGQNGYVANSEENVQSLITSPNVLLNTTAKTEFFKALGKYTKPNLNFIKHVTGINVNSHTEMASSSSAMQIVVNSELAMQAVVTSNTASNAIVASNIVMQAVANSNIAAKMMANSPILGGAFVRNSTGIQYIVNSAVASDEVFANSDLVQIIARNSDSLKKVANSRYSREALMNNNSIFQRYKREMYDTIRRDSSRWTISHFYEDGLSSADGRVATENLFVFFCLGAYHDRNDHGGRVKHKNNKQAVGFTSDVRELVRRQNESNPLPVVSGVSFGGCKFEEVSDGYVTVDVFTPR